MHVHQAVDLGDRAGRRDPAAAPSSQRVDYEGELAVVIGRPCRDVKAENASSVILGYTVANDVTARDQQKADGQFTRAKGYDTFCPLGPWIETELDPADLRVTHRAGRRGRAGRQHLRHGLHRRRRSSSSSPAIMTLLPGDVLLTGTPAGVGPMVDGQTDRSLITVEARSARLTNP